MRKIIFLMMFGMLFGQSSQVARKVIRLASEMETYSQNYENGEIQGITLTGEQKTEMARKYEANAQRILDLLQGVETTEQAADYSSVLIKLNNLKDDADARFYSRYDFRTDAIAILDVAIDFIVNGQPVDAAAELTRLLGRSDRFYSNTKDDTVKILQEVIAGL